ncbi:hypothetical protein PGTUg99_012321 [Puccinia graminis f. sp. tritici]|uniref:Uncharacterized protein n=1 Tax=Puccinia graminis f. sp. tritici TaxID=56615 RepID=A0A5B0PVW3_PUCGR|nr:hypothetical protein PGTUg99_012321 [Puccinia graminis f. sp. tritici]
MKLSCTVYALVLTLLLSTTFCNARNDVVCAYCKEPRAVEVKTKKPLPEAPCGHRLLDNTLCQSMRLKRLYKCKGCKEHSWGNARRTDDLPQEGSCTHESKQKMVYNQTKKTFEPFLEFI